MMCGNSIVQREGKLRLKKEKEKSLSSREGRNKILTFYGQLDCSHLRNTLSYVLHS